MFERYTESARRTIFFARYITLMNEAPGIDPTHLLYALMWDEHSRSNVLFRLRKIFPMYRGRPYKCADYELVKAVAGPPLTDESKKVLTRAKLEADAMDDFWIDTEHLLLGILSEPTCAAAQYLAKASGDLPNARRIVIGNKSSRPDYMAVLQDQSLLKRGLLKWHRLRFKMKM
jgi:ATP-dependent Clp protease ATP-binding subunit ClpC